MPIFWVVLQGDSFFCKATITFLMFFSQLFDSYLLFFISLFLLNKQKYSFNTKRELKCQNEICETIFKFDFPANTSFYVFINDIHVYIAEKVTVE